MKQSPTTAKLLPALVAVQGAMVGIKKTKTNPHLRNRYAGLDDLWDVARPILAQHGLALVQGGCSQYGESPSISFITVETVVFHVSGEWISFEQVIPLGKATAQEVGSATTYARRYGMASILGIVADDDDDGNGASGVGAAPPKTEGRKPPVPPSPKAPAPKAPVAAIAPEPIPHGDFKGRMLDTLTLGEVSSMIDAIDNPNHKWHKLAVAHRRNLMEQGVKEAVDLFDAEAEKMKGEQA